MKIKRTALVIDNGLFQPLAHRLSEFYERVLYWRPWIATLSHSNDLVMGSGYKDIERIESYEQFFDDEQVTWIFPDLHYAPLQEWLRSKGRSVFGSGNGEELELLRGEAKDLMEEIGLPVQKWDRVFGMDALRTYLKKNEDVYIKISTTRGVSETFNSINYDLVKPKLDEMQHELGGLADVQEFIVEHALEAIIENGYDGICVDGKFPKWGQWGVEQKDKSYFAQWKPYEQLPKQVRMVNDKFAPTLKEFKYRGFFFTEVRVTKDGKGYPIDLTCRMGSPSGEAWIELCDNLGEVVEGASNGILVEPKPAGRFAAQAVMISDFAESNWLPVCIPEKIRKHVHLYHSCVVEGQEYVVPIDVDMPQIGSVVGIGKTADEAEKNCRDYAQQIQGYGIKIDLDAMAQSKKELLTL